jgi:Zinc carboxypeptidase
MRQPIGSEGPVTRAELSGYEKTSTHADVLSFIEALGPLAGTKLHVTDFGTTPEGRLLPLLVLSGGGHFTPAAAKAAGRPIVLIQCGIHAGEVEGKEAALMLVRDLLQGRHGDLLDRLTVLVVPLFNADGNDRMDPEHRKLELEHFRGQLGPHGVGTRENAAGINLNRDYMRQQGAEMRLMQSRICHPWNPHWVIDCHTTNGSIHRFAMTYDVPHVIDSGRREPIEYLRERAMPAIGAAVKAHEGMDSFWYGNFLRDEGGEGMGWITYPHHPRFGGNYRGLTNRLDLLLETYSYISFPDRVRATYGFLREALKYAASHGEEILALLETCLEPPREVAVRYRHEAFEQVQARILTREPYTLDGAPIEVDVPHLARFVGEAPVQRPLAYAVHKRIAERLSAHGLSIAPASPGLQLRAEIPVIRSRVVAGGREILEAGTSSHLDAEHVAQTRALPADWRLVYTAQQRGAIACYLLEAGSDDGLIACDWIDQPKPGDEFPAWRVTGVAS